MHDSAIFEVVSCNMESVGIRGDTEYIICFERTLDSEQFCQ